MEKARIGIVTIGGGVPRNWAQQVGPYLEISEKRLGLEDRVAVACCSWSGIAFLRGTVSGRAPPR